MSLIFLSYCFLIMSYGNSIVPNSKLESGWMLTLADVSGSSEVITICQKFIGLYGWYGLNPTTQQQHIWASPPQSDVSGKWPPCECGLWNGARGWWQSPHSDSEPQRRLGVVDVLTIGRSCSLRNSGRLSLRRSLRKRSRVMMTAVMMKADTRPASRGSNVGVLCTIVAGKKTNKHRR